MQKTSNDDIIAVLNTIGYEALSIEHVANTRGNLLKVIIDRCDEKPITIDDCVVCSQTIKRLLNEHNNPHRIEVSSPGSNRLLTRAAHFKRFVNQEVAIQMTDDKTHYRGLLKEADDEKCTLMCVDGCADIDVPVIIYYNQIRRANLIKS